MISLIGQFRGISLLLLLTATLRADLTIEEVAADRTLWPVEIIVQVPLQVPIVANGKQVGSANAPAGRTYRVQSVNPTQVVLDIKGTPLPVDVQNTDILEKAKVMQNRKQTAAANALATATPASTPVATPSSSPKEAAPKIQNEIAASLQGKLVTTDKKKFADFDASTLNSKKYLAIYFSAAWCPPCRRFTPQLVRFYKLKQKYADKFDVIFVSSDKTAESMLDYMNEDKMEWPAVRFDSKQDSGLSKYAGRGIPCLVVLDEKGTVVADPNVNGEYVGPTSAMEKLEKLLKDS